MQTRLPAMDGQIQRTNTALQQTKDAHAVELQTKDGEIRDQKFSTHSAKAEVTDQTQKHDRYEEENKHLKSKVNLWNIIAVVGVIASVVLCMCVTGMTCCLMSGSKSAAFAGMEIE